MDNNQHDSVYKPNSKPIAAVDFMLDNPVAVTLLMLFILVVGVLFLNTTIKKEIFPASTSSVVHVSIVLPQASPAEVESSILLAVESAISGITGITRVESHADFGYARIEIYLSKSVDPQKALQDVESKINSIDSFPSNAKKPSVTLFDNFKQLAMSFIVYGDRPLEEIYAFAEKMRDRLLDEGEVSFVEIQNKKDHTIEVYVSNEALQRHKLTLSDVAEAINKQSVEISLGTVDTNTQEIALKVNTKARSLEEIKKIKILSNGLLTVGDVSTIKTGFDKDSEIINYNGGEATLVYVYAVSGEDPVGAADIGKKFVAKQQSNLPQGIFMKVFRDRSVIFADRLDLMLRNGIVGIILIFIVLGLFLEPKLAFWVMLGIPTSIIGAFIVFALADISINMISMFAFIVTLGMVVDDAVITGEHIYKMREAGMSFMLAARSGIRRMARPVTFAVLTNIITFMPMFFLPGDWHIPFLQIPATVISVMLISLIECLFILPSHLAHSKPTDLKKDKMWRYLSLPSQYCNKYIVAWSQGPLKNITQFALRHRYLSLLAGLMFFFVGTFVPILTGLVKFSFFPSLESSAVQINIDMPDNSFVGDSKKIVAKIMTAAEIVEKEIKSTQQLTKGIYVRIAKNNDIFVSAEMTQYAQSEIGVSEFANQWRTQIGEIQGVESIKVTSTFSPGGGSGSRSDINIEVASRSEEKARAISQELVAFFKNTKGVRDIQDGFPSGKREARILALDEAAYLGIDQRQIAQAIRNAVNGIEAQKYYEGKNEIKIKVYLAQQETNTASVIDQIYIKTQAGYIPIAHLVKSVPEISLPLIERIDGKKVHIVRANVDSKILLADELKQQLRTEVFPQLKQKYQDTDISLDRADREIDDVTTKLQFYFFIACFVIYALLAVLFSSYMQPLAIMLSIPFGISGAMIGHAVLSINFSLFSAIGVVALSGVVVNTGLMLIDNINEQRNNKITIAKASTAAVISRFRPIVITTITTFFGVMPIVFETSKQAQFLIPMAISLSFGVLFSSVITLFVLPSFELAMQDCKDLLSRLLAKLKRT